MFGDSPALRRFLAMSAAAVLISSAGGLAGAGGSLAVVTDAAQQASDDIAVQLKRQNLSRMLRRVESLELNAQRLEDVVAFIKELTQADIDPLWIDDKNPTGLDPDAEVTLKVRDVSALDLLEMVLDKVDADSGSADGSTWQLTKYGTFEFGPRERLNRRKELVIYDIRDLLLEVPNYDDPPEFDLNTIFQQGGQGGGGGGGQSPFTIDDEDPDRRTEQERAQEIQDLITGFIETEQWEDNGGDGGTIRYYRGTLLIRAADYMHRQVGGYDWWPRVAQQATTVDGRRRVSVSANGVDINQWAADPQEAVAAPLPTPARAAKP